MSRSIVHELPGGELLVELRALRQPGDHWATNKAPVRPVTRLTIPFAFFYGTPFAYLACQPIDIETDHLETISPSLKLENAMIHWSERNKGRNKTMEVGSPHDGTENGRIRILIVDDHPIVCQGYRNLLDNQPDLQVCGIAENDSEAIQQVELTNPALAIVDIKLKESNGIELVQHLRSQHANLRILVVSAHEETLFAERALEAGAMGYINKQEAIEKLIDGIRSVLADNVYLSKASARRMLKRREYRDQATATAVDRLTNRELQVFEMISRGLTAKQIAATLYLSPKTIARYQENIKKKLWLSNTTELIQHATRWAYERELPNDVNASDEESP